jgi:hypothetical protein
MPHLGEEYSGGSQAATRTTAPSAGSTGVRRKWQLQNTLNKKGEKHQDGKTGRDPEQQRKDIWRGSSLRTSPWLERRGFTHGRGRSDVAKLRLVLGGISRRKREV